MSDLLSERGRALEDKFFAERDRQLLDAIRQKAEAEHATAALGQQTGVNDGPLLVKLVQLGVRVDTLAAFAVVPLLHVAWGRRRAGRVGAPGDLAGGGGVRSVG
jgi:hypothetical protein